MNCNTIAIGEMIAGALLPFFTRPVAAMPSRVQAVIPSRLTRRKGGSAGSARAVVVVRTAGLTTGGMCGLRSCAGRRPQGWVAVLGHHLVIAVVNGFTLDETPDLLPTNSEAPPPGEPNMVHDYIAVLPRDRFPNLVDLADYFTNGDADERFELLLDLFVDGLAKRARA